MFSPRAGRSTLLVDPLRQERQQEQAEQRENLLHHGLLFQGTELGVFEQEELLSMHVKTDLGLHFRRPPGQLQDGTRAETIMFYPLSDS